MESIKAYTFTKEELKKFYSHSVSDSNPQFYICKTATTLEPSLAISFAGPLSPKFHGTLQYEHHLLHTGIARVQVFLYVPLTQVSSFLTQSSAFLP